MNVGLVGVVFVALFLRASCDNDDEIRGKLEAMEKRLAKMDAIENQRHAKIDERLAAVEQQQGKYSFTPKEYYM